MKNEIVLEAKHVTVELKDKVILRDINLTVHDQETVVFIGPSGSGKTVLLKTMAGIYPPKIGEVLIYQENWQSLTGDEKHDLAEKLGVLFQQGALFDTMTAIENIEFPLREHFNLSEEEMIKVSRDLLAKVNLQDSEDKLPGELSGGMQRRLGIARALALNPSVLFYDDPVAGQDPMQSDQMLTLISDFKKENKSTLVMVTSNMQVAFRMADRIFMVIDQEIVGGVSPDEIKKHPDPRIQQFIHGDLQGPIKIG